MASLLLLAVASMSVAFGLWSKVLTIEGTVHTGNVDAVWFFSDTCEEPEAEGKDVGSATIRTHPDDQEILILEVENAYPSYLVDCQIHFANKGNIPIKIRGHLRSNSGSSPGRDGEAV